MEREYIVLDIDKAIFENETKVVAKSPKEAAQKAGYKNVVRRKNDGNLVVYASHGTYVRRTVYRGSKA